jgi:hypothetical protein
LGQLERLREVIERAALDRLHGGVQVPVRGDDDDRRVRRDGAQFRERGEAVHAGQAHVEEHDIRRVASGFSESVFGGRGDIDAVLLALERAPQRPRDGFFVVDDENGMRHAHRGAVGSYPHHTATRSARYASCSIKSRNSARAPPSRRCLVASRKPGA